MEDLLSSLDNFTLMLVCIVAIAVLLLIAFFVYGRIRHNREEIEEIEQRVMQRKAERELEKTPAGRKKREKAVRLQREQHRQVEEFQKGIEEAKKAREEKVEVARKAAVKESVSEKRTTLTLDIPGLSEDS